MKHGFGPTLRLSAALLVAAGAGICHPWGALRKVRAALRVWFSGLGADGIVDQTIHDRRLATCRGCVLFYSRLQTCGSPLRKELRNLGCYCNMEAGAWFREKTCYLDEIYGTEPHWGWNEMFMSTKL